MQRKTRITIAAGFGIFMKPKIQFFPLTVNISYYFLHG